MMDSDGQHDPEALGQFIKLAREGELDLVVGRRRIAGSKMPWDRRFSNAASSALLSLITRQRLYDVQCGYRMVRTKSIKGLHLERDGFEFETEFLLKMLRSGAKVGWVGIPTIYGDEKSHIGRARDTWRFLSVVFEYLRKERR